MEYIKILIFFLIAIITAYNLFFSNVMIGIAGIVLQILLVIWDKTEEKKKGEKS